MRSHELSETICDLLYSLIPVFVIIIPVILLFCGIVIYFEPSNVSKGVFNLQLLNSSGEVINTQTIDSYFIDDTKGIKYWIDGKQGYFSGTFKLEEK